MIFVSRTTPALKNSCVVARDSLFAILRSLKKKRKVIFGKIIYIPLQSDIAQITWRPDFEQNTLDAKILDLRTLSFQICIKDLASHATSVEH